MNTFNTGKLTRHRTSDTAVSVEIRLKFELIQAFMVILITCKNEEDPMKAIEFLQHFPH